MAYTSGSQQWLGLRTGRWVVVCALLGWLGAAASAQEQLRLQPDTGQFKKLKTYDPATPEGQLQTIRALIAKEQYEEAWDQGDTWIDKYPNQPLLVEAYLLRGDAKIGSRRYYQALFDYERVLQDYPGTEQFTAALDREYRIAQGFIRGIKKRFLGMEIIPAEDDAVEVLIRIQERAPGSDIGEAASLTLAEYYYDIKNMHQAADAYDMFLINYPKSLRREQAMKRMIEASMATYKGPQFDATGLIDAGQRITAYAKEYPAAAERMGSEALLARIDDGLARKALFAARWQLDVGDKVSAAYCYQRVVRDFPRSAAAQQALKELGALGAPAMELLGPPSTLPSPTAAPAAPTTTPAGLDQGGRHP